MLIIIWVIFVVDNMIIVVIILIQQMAVNYHCIGFAGPTTTAWQGWQPHF